MNKLSQRGLALCRLATIGPDRLATDRVEELSRRVASIWSEVLGIDDTDVDQNFFDLGGQSMQAAQIAVRLEEEFGVELPSSIVFRAPTVRESADLLAEIIEST